MNMPNDKKNKGQQDQRDVMAEEKMDNTQERTSQPLGQDMRDKSQGSDES